MVRKIMAALLLMTVAAVLNASEVYVQDSTIHGEQRVLVHQVSIGLEPIRNVEMEVPAGWFVVDSHVVTFNDRLLVVIVIEKAMTRRQRVDSTNKRQ